MTGLSGYLSRRMKLARQAPDIRADDSPVVRRRTSSLSFGRLSGRLSSRFERNYRLRIGVPIALRSVPKLSAPVPIGNGNGPTKRNGG
jgi:hypothetical protein